MDGETTARNFDQLEPLEIQEICSRYIPASPSTFGHALKVVDERCRLARLIRKGAEGPANQVQSAMHGVGRQQKRLRGMYHGRKSINQVQASRKHPVAGRWMLNAKPAIILFLTSRVQAHDTNTCQESEPRGLSSFRTNT